MAKTRQQRRGLSTVVGAVFMILVMVGAINVMLWTMQQQNRVTETIIEKTNSNLNRLNEDIEISNVRVDGGKLNMTVTNAGGAAATLKTIYVVNETAKEQYRYDLDLVVDGRQSKKDVGQGLPLTVKDNIRYSVRLITESGNTVSTSLTPLSSVALPMSLYTIPPTVTPNSNVTVLFTVTNNITDSDLGWAVTPTLQYSCSGCTLTKYVEPSSMTIGKGSTALFKWVYRASGPDMTPVTFNASLTNARQGNFVTEKALIKLVESAQTAFSSEIIISSSLVQKPEIFLIVPSPFGESTSKGLWGVIVANPTNQTMEVSRIVWNMYTSKPSANQQMIKTTDCTETAIFPTPASEWTCPHDNMIEWKNVGSPQQIEGFNAQRFLVTIQPGDLNAGPEPAFMISVSVFTSMGQFTKTGYSSAMDSTGLSLGNVYMTDTTDPSLAVQNSHILGNKSKITAGATIRLNVTIADLDTSSTTEIKSGAKLIVNVPRGFTNVVVQSSTGFTTATGQPKVIPYSDGSTQIVATLAAGEDLGDTLSAEAKVLSFTTTTPSANATRVYIMHAFVDGETDTNFSAGAIAELALQVFCKGYPTCTG